MEFRRAGSTGDPFWEAFRRRHPDVDVVVLPPERGVPSGSVDDVLATRAGLVEVAEALTAAVPGLVVPVELRRGVRPGVVESVGRGSARVADGPRVLDALDLLLAGATSPWRIRRTAGPVAVLDAVRGLQGCRISWGEAHEVLVVTLTGGALDVGDAADELIGER
ncbi:hypothetical protein [Nocardioides daejeonensis]|uniref:hypothetical protein n=1 Tax=Nocardioides daejeonensis TaxID=1046556 RepID=UPI000D748545|nr:hypothetical protein [Nocardioides daejeonensis]